jgi:hypothetical protein
MSTHLKFSNEAQAIAICASNLLNIPANLVARLTFTGACKQALLLLQTAEKVVAEHIPLEVPAEPDNQRAPIYKSPARIPDICPVAVIEKD